MTVNTSAANNNEFESDADGFEVVAATLPYGDTEDEDANAPNQATSYFNFSSKKYILIASTAALILLASGTTGVAVNHSMSSSSAITNNKSSSKVTKSTPKSTKSAPKSTKAKAPKSTKASSDAPDCTPKIFDEECPQDFCPDPDSQICVLDDCGVRNCVFDGFTDLIAP